VRKRPVLSALVAVVLACAAGCHGRDAKAMAVVQGELALLRPPSGLTATDQKVGLGEMYAEGAQTYCVGDEKAGQAALDAMLRDAGWAPLSSSTTADTILWHYRKDQCHGLLVLERQHQPCGRRFRVEVVAPI
jgi:hypothetical protein